LSRVLQAFRGLALLAAGWPRSISAQGALFAEVAFAGDEVHLDANPIGVFEEHRMVAGSEIPGLGRVKDVRIEFENRERVHGVDACVVARAEAEVVEPGTVLVKSDVAAI